MVVQTRYLKLRWLSFILIASFFVTTVCAQVYTRKTYSLANGLPGGNVEFIFEDSRGYLWISAFVDLMRFDGTSFTKFGPADGVPWVHNYIVFEDRKNTVWGASNSGSRTAVIKYVNGKFETLPFDKVDAVKYIFSFYATPDNNVLACTDYGVFERKNGHWVHKDIGLGKDVTIIRNMVDLDDGSLLICTPRRIFRKMVTGQIKTVAEAIDGNGFNKVQKMGSKVLIAAFRYVQLYQHDSLQAVHDDEIKGHYILGSNIDKKGKIYLSCTDGTFYIIDGPKISILPMQDNVSGGFTKSICNDREGNIWIGNLDLVRLRATSVEKFEKKDGLQHSDNRGLIVDKANNVYFGDAGHGFNYWDGQKFTAHTELLPANNWPQFEHHFVYRFAQDELDRIWMLTNSSQIIRHKNHYAEELTTRFNPRGQRITQLLFDPADSTIYISADSIIKIKNDQVVDKIGFAANNGMVRPKEMCFDTKHRLWVNLSNGDVAVVDMRTKTVSYEGGRGGDLHFASMTADPDGSVWAGTSNLGLLHFEATSKGIIKQLPPITQKEGLYSNFIADAAYDNAGWLWVLSAGGVTRMKPGLKNADSSLVNQRFGIDDGLDPASYVDSHIGIDRYNNVWISTYSGIYRFKNARVSIESTPPKMHIEKLFFNNESLDDSTEAASFTDYFHLPVNPVLAYNKNNFTVVFNGIAFTKREELECEYMLEGLEKTWTPSDAKKEVSFVNLKAGTYVFKVRARRKNARWADQATFAFRIRPPFWETWWFRTFIIAVASGVLIIAFRRRIAQINKKAKLQQQMQELEMQALKARMNPHFIYNAMNSIQSLVISDEPESAVRYIGKFAKLLRQVLDNSDKSLIPLDRELSSLKLYIELEALRLHVDFDYSIDVDEVIIPEEELIPPLVLQPYVENALWHGLSNKAGLKKLSINIYQKEKFLIAEITDNGIGRKRAAEIKSKNAAAAASKGLDITKRRLTILNNDTFEPVVIEDLYDNHQNPAGTKVSIRILRSALT